MSKPKKDFARIKATYICPGIIACFAVEFSFCVGSPIGAEHEPALPGGTLEEEDDGTP